MSRRALRWAGALALAVGLPACAVKQPVLYPNATLQHAGPAQAQEDVEACTELAYQYVKANEDVALAGRTATGSATGAATGAAVGAVAGNAARGAAMGAAGGAVRPLARGLFSKRDPDPVVKRFVAQCLHEKGYQVIGWR